MKKITSILLLVSLLISILCVSGVMMNIAAEDEPVKHTLPDGTIMESGKYVLPEKDRLGDDGVTGYIRTADDFRAMKPGGRYSLANDIDLTVDGNTSDDRPLNHTPLFFDADYNGKSGIRFDGGGYTITTDDMLFYRIPKDSTFVNFVIAGEIIKNSSAVLGKSGDKKEHPFHSLAPLCAHAAGGTFKDIINEAYVRADAASTDSSDSIRLSGLIGACGLESVLIQNCHNKATIWSLVHGETCAVAGILAYTEVKGDVTGKGTQRTYLMGCRNDGQIKNTSTSTAAVKYAGGILGVKHNDSQVQIIDCSTVSRDATFINAKGETEKMIVAETESGRGAGCDGCTAIANLNNLTYDPNAIPIHSAEDFANMSGNNNYYLLESFRVVEQNKNVFTGTIYGATRRIDSDIPHFAHHINESQCNSLALVVEGGYQKITTAEEFYTLIKNPDLENNKFYLGADITLTGYSNWTGPQYWETNREKAKNGEIPIILDGCGYKITTNKPIFVELPGGGDPKDGTHSIMRNIVIEGNITVSQSELDSYKVGSYENGNSIGALVGKTNGGIFENIINNASVTFNGNTNARVGGIVGSTFNDDILMIDCVNNGAVTATVHGERCGVGGIIGLVGYNDVSTDAGVTANLNNCVNTAEVKNNSNNDFHVYAGGVVGVKFQNQTVVYLRDCNSTGKIFAKTAYGKYCADRLQQNFHIIKTK